MSQNNYGLLLVFFLLAVAGNWLMKSPANKDAETIMPLRDHESVQPGRVSVADLTPMEKSGGLERLGLGDDPFGLKEKYSRLAPFPDKLYEMQRLIQSLSAPDSALPVNSTDSPFAQMMQPVDFDMTSDYGRRKDPIRMNALENHTGEDYAAPANTEIPTPSDGVIEFAGERPGYGLTVEIKHSEKISSLFAHLSEITVTAGEQVKKGQIIGKSGSTGRSTGPHLHYELRVDGKPVNPKMLVVLLTMLAGQQDTGDFPNAE